jgi:hypothetical protein
MELEKLESIDFRERETPLKGPFSLEGSDAEKIKLAHHTDEELRQVEYRPGLTAEQVQELYKKKVLPHLPSANHENGHYHKSDQPHSEDPSAEKKKDKRKFKILVNNYRLIIRILIFSYQMLHGAYLVFYIAPIFSNPFTQWMIKLTSIISFGTMMFNYIHTTQVSSLSFKRKKTKAFLSRKEYKECDRCDNNWKPTRTHHCSVQAHDVLRMDHYCPVTLNTIGMRNHGVFFMTGLYHLICCLWWMVLYLIYAGYEFKPLLRTGVIRTIYMIILGIADYLTVASLAGLSVGIVASHIPFMVNNRTTLEGYGESVALISDLRKGN